MYLLTRQVEGGAEESPPPLHTTFDAKDLACAKDLTILSVAGRYNKLVQYGRESAHKSRAQGDPTSLGDYINAIQHIIKEEYETISRA